jgi:hypothetical protein
MSSPPFSFASLFSCFQNSLKPIASRAVSPPPQIHSFSSMKAIGKPMTSSETRLRSRLASASKYPGKRRKTPPASDIFSWENCRKTTASARFHRLPDTKVSSPNHPTPSPTGASSGQTKQKRPIIFISLLSFLSLLRLRPRPHQMNYPVRDTPRAKQAS